MTKSDLLAKKLKTLGQLVVRPDRQLICDLMGSRVYNSLLARGTNKRNSTRIECGELKEIIERTRTQNDISDHLTTIFCESVSTKPKLIVELGVRGGESTFVFERVAKLYNVTIVSVDIDDCLKASAYPSWNFVKRDDIAFAKEFDGWCRERGIASEIDVLFIDTSHLYEHTLQEIQSWFPFLTAQSKVNFSRYQHAARLFPQR